MHRKCRAPAYLLTRAHQVGINPGWTPHVQKIPQKAVAKAKLLIESRQQKRVLNLGGAQTTRGSPELARTGTL
jgi:hypothetical protein